MGKSNRIRVKRVDTKKMSAPKKKQQGMPGWAMSLIAVVVAVVILSAAVLTFMSTNGVFGRMQTAMESENYSINKNVFSYYFYSAYINFQSEYESYMNYFSLDTTKPLKDQTYGKAASATGYAYETSFLGAFEGTWYDYFLEQTKAQIKSTLVYCEAADVLGIELDDEDYATIDANITSLETMASLYGTTVNTYVVSTYGAGVSVKDVRRGLEISALANKCGDYIAEQINDSVTDEMVDKEYADNKVDYDLVDYMMYTVSVKYDDAVREVLGDDYSDNYTLTADQEKEVKEKYIELIAEAEKKADEFADIDTAEEFYDTITNYILSEAYDNSYEAVNFDDEKDPITEPSDADKATIKEKTIASVLAKFEENKDKEDATIEGDAVKDADGKWTLYGIAVDAAYATELNTIYKNLYANFIKSEDTLTKEGVSFSDTNDFLLGAFKDLIVDEETDDKEIEKIDVNGTKVLYAGDEDLAEKDDDYVMYEYYNANVYMLTKAPYQDVDHSKNIAYILATDKALAEEIIAALDKEEDIDLEKFESVAKEFDKATYQTYDNYTKGTFGVAAFDNWLFDKDLAAGTYTDKYITMDEKTENGTTTGSYCVAFYDEDGHENWFVAAKNTVLNDSFTAKNTELEDTYKVEFNDKVLANLDA